MTGNLKNKNTEEFELEKLFKWAKENSGIYPELNLMYAIYDRGPKHTAEAIRLKKSGAIKKEMPNICLPVPRGKYNGLYITLQSERISLKQVSRLIELKKQGYAAEYCGGWRKARCVIVRYISFIYEEKEPCGRGRQTDIYGAYE